MPFLLIGYYAEFGRSGLKDMDVSGDGRKIWSAASPPLWVRELGFPINMPLPRWGNTPIWSLYLKHYGRRQRSKNLEVLGGLVSVAPPIETRLSLTWVSIYRYSVLAN